MDASVPSAVGDAPMRSKRVANDSTFRGALLHGASYQTRTTAEGDAATTGVPNRRLTKRRVQIFF